MQIIISNTNVGALLKASDNILKKYKTDGVIPESIQGQITLSVLKKLSERNDHFSVCDINRLAKLHNVHITKERMDMFDSLHCVSYADMTQETREYLMACLVDSFRSNIVMANSNI